MRNIEKDGVVLARHITQADWKDGLSFFSEAADGIQVGAWKYDKGVELKRHCHNEVPRQVVRTHEALFVLRGRAEATVYDLNDIEVAHITLEAGDILTLLDSGHGYRILEDGTQVLEVKNGPYLGADVDRRRF